MSVIVKQILKLIKAQPTEAGKTKEKRKRLKKANEQARNDFLKTQEVMLAALVKKKGGK